MVNLFRMLLTFFLTFFSVSVMSFIAMACPVGPWIDVSLVLLALLLIKIVYPTSTVHQRADIAGYAVAASSLGGSVATACGFALPTLYFLNAELFMTYLQQPLLFIALVAGIIITAGGLGMMIAHVCAPVFLADATMTFPIGQMTYSLMWVGNSMRKSYELLAGITVGALFSLIYFFTTFIPRKLLLIKPLIIKWWSIPGIAFRSEWVLMLVAIGFVTGHVIAIPLGIGVLIKILAADPLHYHFFNGLAVEDFFFAFCSGIVVHSTLMSLIELPRSLYHFFTTPKKNQTAITFFNQIKEQSPIPVVLLLVITAAYLGYFHFSFLSQIYLLIFTALCTYQIALIGGKTGLAPIGRFATWVMVPFMMLFGAHPVHVTLVSAFVEISGMVVVDTLFGRKMAQLAGLETRKMVRYQLMGLVLSALLGGIVFWLFIHYFGLGGLSPLLAQRCQARALLVHATHFDYYVMGIGVLAGLGLRTVGVNSTLVLGGLLLPIDFSLLLILGGMLTYLVKDREAYTPFWSGVFAASALGMLLRTFF